jgi:hypothetical protein
MAVDEYRADIRVKVKELIPTWDSHEATVMRRAYGNVLDLLDERSG